MCHSKSELNELRWYAKQIHRFEQLILLRCFDKDDAAMTAIKQFVKELLLSIEKFIFSTYNPTLIAAE